MHQKYKSAAKMAYLNGSKVAGESSNSWYEVFATHNGAVTGGNIGLAQSVAALGDHCGGQVDLKVAVYASICRVTVAHTCNHTDRHLHHTATVTDLLTELLYIVRAISKLNKVQSVPLYKGSKAHIPVITCTHTPVITKLSRSLDYTDLLSWGYHNRVQGNLKK